METIKPKVLPINNLESIEELVYQYLEKNDLLQYADLQKVMANIAIGQTRKTSITLVDDINEPTCFYWAGIVPKPILVTEMVELISMGAWVEDESQMDALMESMKRKAKLRGVTNFFVSDHYPFSLLDDSEYEEFETAKMIKL